MHATAKKKTRRTDKQRAIVWFFVLHCSVRVCSVKTVCSVRLEHTAGVYVVFNHYERWLCMFILITNAHMILS